MKKTTNDMKTEYDLTNRKGERGKYYKAYREGHTVRIYKTNKTVAVQYFAIEVDGSQHVGQEEYDRERTSFLEAKGNRVWRFWNSDVMNNIEGVLQCIVDAIGKMSTSTTNTIESANL